jgi:hypothetical protein
MAVILTTHIYRHMILGAALGQLNRGIGGSFNPGDKNV